MSDEPSAPSDETEQKNTPHDKIFKTLFRTFLKDLMELVHPELASVLDLEHPKFLEQEALTELPEGERSLADLVAEVSARVAEALMVLIHVEVEGKFRKLIDERMWRYSLQFGLKHRCSVISVVVFLRGGPPGVEVRKVIKRVGPFEIHRFRYLALGLSKSVAEEWLARPQPLAAALAALMRPASGDRVEQKLSCLRSIQRSGLDDARRYLLARVVQKYVELDREEQSRYEHKLQAESNKEVREMAITWEEALAEREARGKAQGKAEGETRGRIKALQDVLLLTLNRRFSSPPSAVREKILAMEDPIHLNALVDQALTADSLSELDLG